MEGVSLDSMRSMIIKEGDPIHDDKNRLQLPMPSEHDYLLRLVMRALADHDLTRGRSASEVNLLFSLEGCGRQLGHYDWEPEWFSHNDVPLGVILALEDCARFVIFASEDDAFGEEVVLSAGDVLVFEGDVLHAGAAYPFYSNLRMHIYLDTPLSLLRRRQTGRTVTHWPNKGPHSKKRKKRKKSKR